MRETSTYKLNIWDKTDRIMMEDFNGDNLKVDSALKALADEVAKKTDMPTVEEKLPWVKIAETTLSAAEDQVAVLVPDADRYSRYLIRYDVSGCSQANLTWTGGDEKLLAYESMKPMLRCAGMVRAVVMPRGGIALDFAGGHSDADGDNNDGGYTLMSGAATTGGISIGIRGSSDHLLDAGSFLDVYGFKK